MNRAVLKADDLLSLFTALAQRNYTTFGPTIKDNAIVYDKVDSVDQLPQGWLDIQDGGRYRLQKEGAAYFGFVVGPHSWKKLFFPPERRLWSVDRSSKEWKFTSAEMPNVKVALIGVRACELAALEIQDKIFMQGPFADSHYKEMRRRTVIVAVNCTRAGGTCFCASMKTGPKATRGYDLALTEIITDSTHCFILESATQFGEEILHELPHQEADEEQITTADEAIRQAESTMGRQLNTDGLKELLYRNFDNLHWEQIAERCLSCSNCTLVCPTCFCSSVEDSSDLSGANAERWRRWDSCFSQEFTYIHGGHIRASVMSRYRQWMTHKLGYWQEQFGSSGCVGCGRCITWCPVGIDITEEAVPLRKKDFASGRRKE